ncbi:hypothetical protein OEA41_006338 [Lepraria neglecta]|uniref:Uncharacterized protein n=1 Tax=Lepraria neglecta TaxID=209136 RepID=A0AAD9Z7T2_9LECA|nr:hypothetical protein OEA41_006338 [Lepraria neglecta]
MPKIAHYWIIGWVVQERILSRQIVQFTQGRLYFESQTDRPRSENGDVQRDKTDQLASILELFMSSSHHFHSSTPGRPLKKNIISAGDHFSPELLLRWYGLVEFYTAAKLTYQSDKLVAIGGMAYET